VVNQHLAQLSNTLIYSAMVVYMLALIAFATDLSGRGRALRAPARAKVAAGAKRVGTTAKQPARTSAARVRARELQVSGVSGVSAGRTAATLGAEPEERVVTESVAAPAVTAGGSGSGAGAASATATPAEPGSVQRRAAGIAISLTWLAFLVHLGGVVARGVAAHRAPWGNMYEFSISGAVVVIGVFLITLTRRDLRYLGTFIVGPVLLSLGLGVTVFYTADAQLVPALQSFWLIIHVSVAFVASGLLTMAFSVTILQLVQDRRETLRALDRAPKYGAFMDLLPPSAELERTAYRLNAIAFPLWTFTLMAGAIWAESAWGRYWNWDPKEVWTFIIWVVYACYLHARATRGWDGRRAAYLGLVGFACLLVNWFVVNVFFSGLHSYAGIGKS
jgi:cytochrome c-type biogenesis protein CcsB